MSQGRTADALTSPRQLGVRRWAVERAAGRQRAVRTVVVTAALGAVALLSVTAWTERVADRARADTAAYEAVKEAVLDARSAARAIDACVRATERGRNAAAHECRRVTAAHGRWRSRGGTRREAFGKLGSDAAAEFRDFGAALEVLAGAVPRLTRPASSGTTDARLQFTTLAHSVRGRAERMAAAVDRSVRVNGRAPGLRPRS
jgi:hypothetical protein